MGMADTSIVKAVQVHPKAADRVHPEEALQTLEKRRSTVNVIMMITFIMEAHHSHLKKNNHLHIEKTDRLHIEDANHLLLKDIHHQHELVQPHHGLVRSIRSPHYISKIYPLLPKVTSSPSKPKDNPPKPKPPKPKTINSRTKPIRTVTAPRILVNKPNSTMIESTASRPMYKAIQKSPI